MTAPVRIAMWSGPRNISTAMMRAWENRDDTTVIDEPFYAHYLKATGVNHPVREEVLASQSTDAAQVAAMLTGPVPGAKPIWYQKHMTQHMLPDMRLDWLDQVTNCFLIRDPEAVVASFTIQRPDAAAWELGFEQQTRLFDHVCDKLGHAPPVIDATDVLKDPRGMLGALCARLAIPFSERMLSWPSGPRASVVCGHRTGTRLWNAPPGLRRIGPATSSCRTPSNGLPMRADRITNASSHIGCRSSQRSWHRLGGTLRAYPNIFAYRRMQGGRSVANSADQARRRVVTRPT